MADGSPFRPPAANSYGSVGQYLGGQTGGGSPPKFTGAFADSVTANNANPARPNRMRFLTGNSLSRSGGGDTLLPGRALVETSDRGKPSQNGTRQSSAQSSTDVPPAKARKPGQVANLLTGIPTRDAGGQKTIRKQAWVPDIRAFITTRGCSCTSKLTL
jgi:hypothetical protein